MNQALELEATNWIAGASEADLVFLYVDYAEMLEDTRLASARAIMEKFVNKVDTGRARSKETYAEMKAWLEE